MNLANPCRGERTATALKREEHAKAVKRHEDYEEQAAGWYEVQQEGRD